VLARLLHTAADEKALVNACKAMCYLTRQQHDLRPHPWRTQTIIDSGVALCLTKLLSHTSAQVQELTLVALVHLLPGEAQQTQRLLDCGLVQRLPVLLAHSQAIVRRKACQAVQRITTATPAQIEGVLAAGFAAPLLVLLEGADAITQENAARALSPTSGSEHQIR